MTSLAIITGAASGIGLGCAKRLLKGGWSVIGIGQSEEALRSATKEVDAPLGRLTMLRCDVSDPDQVVATFADIARQYGPVNALVCSAGVMRTAPVADATVEDFDLMFNVNVRGSWLCAREALPQLRAAAAKSQLARIIFMSSIAAHRPKIGNGLYAASKAAIANLARVLAVECAEAGVLVNVIAPGTVDTPMIRAASDPAQTGRYRPSGNSPLGRVAHPDDIAAVVDFLLGPQSAYVTGITITVDGGTTAAVVPPNS